jgi:hypothetical protein
MTKTISDDRLQRFFLQCARKSFWQLGLNNPAVIDYVATMLTTFARADHLYRLHAPSGRRLDSVTEMVEHYHSDPATPQSKVLREREMRQYIGDYTLFMSGLFRSFIEKRGVLSYYVEQGRRSYWKVSEVDLAFYHTGFLLFQELSRNFECYAGALDYMRQACFATTPETRPFGQFLHHVDGWVKTHLSEN